MIVGISKIKYIFVLFLFWSCSKPAIPEPDPAILNSPENNNTCIPLISNSIRAVISFGWTESLNTDSYELVVRNNVTGSEQKKLVDLTSTTLSLIRGVPYTWWILSKSEISTVDTNSAVWSFYLEALQQEGFLPFSAQLISPQEGATVTLTSGQYNLQWTGSDLDNDIAYFQVHIGTDQAQLSLVQDNHTSSSYQASLSAGQTYYWKIVTVDQVGNRSESSILSFVTS